MPLASSLNNNQKARPPPRRIEGDHVSFRDDRDLANDRLLRVDQWSPGRRKAHPREDFPPRAGESKRQEALLSSERQQRKEKIREESEHGGMIFIKKGFATRVPPASAYSDEVPCSFLSLASGRPFSSPKRCPARSRARRPLSLLPLGLSVPPPDEGSVFFAERQEAKFMLSRGRPSGAGGGRGN